MIGKLRKMELYNKTLYTKPNTISSFMFMDDEHSEKKKTKSLLFSFSDHNIEIDDISMSSNTSSLNKKISLSDIEKKTGSKIYYITKIPFKNDYFITTENSYYFLYNSDFKLIKLGKPVSSLITCAVSLPFNQNFLACGTLNSNLIILNPYTNQTIEIMLKRKYSLLYILRIF